LVFPSMSIEYELRSHQPPEVVDGVLRGFNRWLEEDWGFAHQGRLFAVPLISMTEPVLAVRELDRVLTAGARAIQILPGKRANGKSPADLDLDPFWGRVNESGVLVCFHIGDSGAQDLFQFDLAETGQRNTGFNRSALQWYVHADRPIMDTMAMLIMGNLFGRFPKVKVASIENGSGWLAYLLKRLDMAADAGRSGPWPGGRLGAAPSDVFRQHVLVSPYLVEDLPALVELIGAKSVMYGSDFPHPEDSQPPPAFLQALDGLDSTEVLAIMHDNLSAFLS
jgi:predicted TIM-barrel fold metal-dependent hydrolase